MPIAGDFGAPLINDGPNGDVYQIEASRKYRIENPGTTTQIAEPQSILALGLALQFQNQYKYFEWTTGALNLNDRDGYPNYSPWHPSQIPRTKQNKRALGSLLGKTEKTNLLEKRAGISPEVLDNGYQSFVA
jgi:hypothetical protein